MDEEHQSSDCLPQTGKNLLPRERSAELAAQWQNETWFMSNADNIAKHPAYQEIMEPNHWFWALNLITKFDAVKAEHAGDVKAMTQDWLDWGKTKLA